MADPLDLYAAAFAESRDRMHDLAHGLSHDAFNWKPNAQSWSVAECIVHLNTIAKGYLPALEREVARDDAPRADGPFRYGALSRLFVAAVRPGSRAMRTASAMKPPLADGRFSAIDRARAMSGLDASTERYRAVCARAEGLDLRRIRLKSPFAPVWFSLGAYLDGLGQHALRHTIQAERVATRPEFPR